MTDAPDVLSLRTTVHGVGFDALTELQVVDRIVAASLSGRGGVVVTPNIDILRQAVDGGQAQTLVARADLVVADGMPIVWASRLGGTSLPERVTGADLVKTLSTAAADTGLSVFLLGGDFGVAERARDRLVRLNPRLRVAGTHCPPLGFEDDELQLALIDRLLTATRPDIVYVALGFPKQEALAERLRQRFPSIWFLGVGGAFSMLTGDVSRAPRMVQRLGLEWLYRLAQEPTRLFRRYLVLDLPFAARLLSSSLAVRLRRRR